jgi:electron transport complex protein RnfB
MSSPLHLFDALDAALPQTQCRQCGFDGCRPYAQAIADGRADINRCPPGGNAGVARLAALTGTAVLPLDPSCGAERPPHVARIDEAWCIGCTLCIQACPIDAIVGAAKLMHTVIPQYCSGCDLCVAPCPMDCIETVPVARAWTDTDAASARARHIARGERLLQREEEQATHRSGRHTATTPPIDVKQALIQAALTRARRRRTANAR